MPTIQQLEEVRESIESQPPTPEGEELLEGIAAQELELICEAQQYEWYPED